MDKVQAILAVLTLPCHAGAPSHHQAVISTDFTGLGMVIATHTWFHAHSDKFQLPLQERFLVPKEKENLKRWSFVPKAKKSNLSLITLTNCWHLCEGLEFWKGEVGRSIGFLPWMQDRQGKVRKSWPLKFIGEVVAAALWWLQCAHSLNKPCHGSKCRTWDAQTWYWPRLTSKFDSFLLRQLHLQRFQKF